MKKVVIRLIILITIVGCSEIESKKVEDTEVSTTTNEDAKFWKFTQNPVQKILSL
jgi:uncharacterized protein YceK